MVLKDNLEDCEALKRVSLLKIFRRVSWINYRKLDDTQLNVRHHIDASRWYDESVMCKDPFR